jgi:hypothetical protein
MFAQPVPAESSRFELSQGHYWLTLHGLARNLRDFSRETMRDSSLARSLGLARLVSREVSFSQKPRRYLVRRNSISYDTFFV